MDYWIIPSRSIGGSEIRLINNWVFAKKNLPHNSKLVISPLLLEKLKMRYHLNQQLDELKNDIIQFDFPDQFTQIQKSFKHLLSGQLKNAKTVYFLLHFPVLLRKRMGQCFIYIHPGTTMFSNSNLNGLIGQLLFAFKADIVDVLDPAVYSIFKKNFFYKKNRIKLTEFGINQSTHDLVQQIDYKEKIPSLVYIGTFIFLKQIIELLQAIQVINFRIENDCNVKPSFFIIGKGFLEKEVTREISFLKEKGIDITHIVTNNPIDYLLKSKIIFSVQKHNNYPSQALIEGIFCGCLPVLTDCGNSKDIAPSSFSELVKEDFTPEEIAEACSRILSLSKTEFEEKSKKAIHHLKINFSTIRMANYYLSLTNLL